MTGDEVLIWINCHRPEINQTRAGWEVMGIDKLNGPYLFSGRTLQECVIKANKRN